MHLRRGPATVAVRVEEAPQQTSVSWSELTSWRSECHARFGTIHQVPIVAVDAEMRRLTAAARHVLDVGAGRDKPLRDMLDLARTSYHSLDSDPAGEFDFRELSEVPAELRFDLAVANQVLEHVGVAEGIEIVRGVANVLESGARFVATVPNPAHPVRQWGDATHVTAWALFDLYGLLRLAGLEVETLARYGKRRLSWNPWRRLVTKAVAREFRIDWCDSLLIVGSKP